MRRVVPRRMSGLIQLLQYLMRKQTRLFILNGYVAVVVESAWINPPLLGYFAVRLIGH